MTQEEPILRLNPETDSYEGYLRVQVPAELFRRRLLTEVEQHTSADLTNPATWAEAITCVGKVRLWLDRPHVTISPIEGIPQQTVVVPIQAPTTLSALKPLVAKRVEEKKKEKRAASGTAKTPYDEIEEDLRVRAETLPPYQWLDDSATGRLITPIPNGMAKSPKKQRIYYMRTDQKKILAQLLKEWEAGTYILSVEAAVEQEAYERDQAMLVTKKIEVVAEVVNGSRLR